MAYKLQGYKLEYCSEHIVSYRKMSAGKRMKVVCDSKEDGEAVHSYLKGVYGSKSYDKGLDWEDFTMIFSSKDDRDDAYKDLDGALTEFREANPEHTPMYGTGTGDDPTSPDDSDTEKTDWTTYIIIGAAAAIIIALLIPWKRK